MRLLSLLLLLAALASPRVSAAPVALETPAGVPRSLGLQISVNFSDRDADSLVALGIAWVRVQIDWEAVERGARGRYFFDQADPVLDRLARRGLRPLILLAYNHGFYRPECKACAIDTPELRRAFAAYARALADHVRCKYPGLPVLYEVWNEPDSDDNWKPRLDAGQYTQLAAEVSRALRSLDSGSDPRPGVLGPAVSNLNSSGMQFLRDCFRHGLLRHLDGLSVHAYRHDIPGDREPRMPETAGADYARVRAMMAEAGRVIPIVSGEWGYGARPAAVKVARPEQFVREDEHPAYLARTWLVNLMHGISLSIWYEWRDADRLYAGNWVGNAGLLAEKGGKPAFESARTLLASLSGTGYLDRLPAGIPERHVLRFKDETSGRVALACWTTGNAPDTAVIATYRFGTFRTRDLLGVEGLLSAGPEGLRVPLSVEPRYVLGLPP